MRILDRKEKNSIALKTQKGRVHIALDDKNELRYLKYAAHMLGEKLVKAVYCFSPKEYLFVSRSEDAITVQEKHFIDESEAQFDIDDFFEGRPAAPFTFNDFEIPAIKKFNKKIVALAVIVFIVVSVYILYSIIKPPKPLPPPVTSVPSVPAKFTDSEKNSLKVLGSRLVADKLTSVISSVRADQYARIAAMTVRETDGPLVVSYNVVTTEEYLYPVVGSTSTAIKGVWEKTRTDTIALNRSDIKSVSSRDFDTCSEEMLESGFYVKSRAEKCADLTYEGDAAGMVKLYSRITSCQVALNTFNVSLGKGTIDVTLCR